MIRVVFICSGNICRSPMAERLFLAAARQRGVDAMAISMGTLNLVGRSASREAIEALRQIGVDLSDHRSQGLSIGLLRHADRVLVMEHAHRRRLLALDSVLADRIELLGQHDPAGPDEIDDPVDQPLPAFIATRDRLVRAIDGLLRDLAP